jgi:iron complex outermembrane receptor protein
MWPAVQAILLGRGVDITAIPAPPPAGATILRVLNPTTENFDEIDPAYVQDVGEMQPTINNTFELGYKGLIGERFVAQADLWHSRIRDFIGPLRVETPNVFFDPEALAAYLSTPAFGLSPTEIQQLTEGIARIPVGTVTPENAEDPADLFLTYRNFGDVNLTGIDLGVTWFLDRLWTLGLSYSYTSKDFFGDASGISDIALNAPRHKAGAHLTLRDRDRGFEVGSRVRFVDTFPVLSGAFVGQVDWYTVVDVSASWQVVASPGTTLSLLVQNALDNEHREFVGVPELGRVAALRLTQRL